MWKMLSEHARLLGRSEYCGLTQMTEFFSAEHRMKDINISFHVCMVSHSTIFNLIKRQKNRQKKTNIDEGPYSVLPRTKSNFPVLQIPTSLWYFH